MITYTNNYICLRTRDYDNFIRQYDEGHRDMEYGQNYFYLACVQGRLDIMQWMFSNNNINNKIDINGHHGKALIQAVVRGYMQIIKWLITNGADIKINNEIFLYACDYGHFEIAQYLQSIGADIYVQNGNAFLISIERYYDDIALWLFLLDEEYFTKLIDEHQLGWKCVKRFIDMSEDETFYYQEIINSDKLMCQSCLSLNDEVDIWISPGCEHNICFDCFMDSNTMKCMFDCQTKLSEFNIYKSNKN